MYGTYVHHGSTSVGFGVGSAARVAGKVAIEDLLRATQAPGKQSEIGAQHTRCQWKKELTILLLCTRANVGQGRKRS